MENDPTVLDALLETESWQTLATFARESARTSLYTCFYSHESIVIVLIYFSYTTAQRPIRPAPDVPSTRIMDDDVPAELFDEVATPAHGNGGPSANVRVCPHCTFENTNGGNDCEVCGLPL
jgi:nuclear protein localization family protein 4